MQNKNNRLTMVRIDKKQQRRISRGILGARTSYYRSINGTKLITEEQQKLIVSLFQRYGYDTDNLFDEYIYAY